MSIGLRKRPNKISNLTRGIGFQSVVLAGTTGIAQLIVAVLYIWTARSAGPEVFGQFVTAIALGTATVGFLDFGTNSYWVREISAGRMAHNMLGKNIANKVLAAGILSVFWILLWTIFIPGTVLFIAGAILFSSLINQTFQVSLRAMGRGDLVSISILSDRSTALIIFGILSVSGISPVDGLWIGLTGGSLVAASIGWFVTPTDFRPKLRLSLKINPWTGARHYGLANMAISAQSFDTPILTIFGGASSAGLYAAVARWTQPMTLLANAFSSAAAPHIAHARNSADAWHHMRKSIWIPASAIVICVGVFFAAPTLVMFLVGEEFKDSSVVLQVLALGTMPAVANQPLFVFLQARGFDRPVSFLATFSVVVQLCLVAILASQTGAVGAAFAIVVSQLLIFFGLVLILISSHWRRNDVADSTQLGL